MEIERSWVSDRILTRERQERVCVYARVCIREHNGEGGGCASSYAINVRHCAELCHRVCIQNRVRFWGARMIPLSEVSFRRRTMSLEAAVRLTCRHRRRLAAASRTRNISGSSIVQTSIRPSLVIINLSFANSSSNDDDDSPFPKGGCQRRPSSPSLLTLVM